METVITKGEQVWILEVTPEALHADVRRLDEKLFTLDGCIRALYDGMTALSSMWEGEAHEVFCSFFMEQCRKLEEFYAFSIRLRTSIETAAAEYQKCEAEAKRMAGALGLESEEG